MINPRQLGFNFEDSPESSESGIDAWRAARQARVQELSLRSGLPVGHLVEVELESGPLLRGKLLMADDLLWIETGCVEQAVFEVDGVRIRIREIKACVRQD